LQTNQTLHKGPVRVDWEVWG